MTYFNWKPEVKKSRGRQGKKLIVQYYSRDIFRNTWDHLGHLGFEGTYICPCICRIGTQMDCTGSLSFLTSTLEEG
jgi:hypothetical protein